MTTVEKLFVQIFERNNRIKQQVKQQTELYLQNLVSKLLIDGIDPPPWLWNPNQSSDVPKALNKEELISEIFLPRPHHPVRFDGSQYCPYNQSVTHETAEILDRSSKAIDACSNSDSGARQVHAVAFEEDNAGCGTNAVPEVEVSVTSPKDETEPRISNVFAAQEQSLVRIQRSKSRQKALELRASSKAKRKNHSREGTLAVSLAQDRLSFFGRNEVDLVNGMEDLGKSFVISHESCDNENLNEGDSREKENEIVFAASYNRISSNSAAGATFSSDGLKPDCLDDILEKDCKKKVYNKEISSFHCKYNAPMEDFCTSNADYSDVQSSTPTLKQGEPHVGSLESDLEDLHVDLKDYRISPIKYSALKISPDYSDVQSSTPTLKQGGPHVGSLESDLEDLPVDLKDYKISPIKYSALKIIPDYSEVHVQSSTLTHQANNESNAFQISGTENYMGISLKEGSKCIPELDIAKYQHTVEGKEKSTSVPHGIEVERLEIDYYASKDNLDMIGSVGDDRHLDPSKACEIRFSEKLQSVKGYSLPSNKRRKFEKEETSSFSSSPGFRIQIEPWSAINSNINVRGESKAVLGQSTIVDNCDDEQIYQTLTCQLTKSMEDSLEFIKNESRSHSVVLLEHENISSSPNLNQGEESILLTSATETGGVPQGSLLSELDLAEGSFKVRKNQKSDHEDEAFVNTEALIDAERSINNDSHIIFDSPLSGSLAQSPAKWDLEMIGADQTMPVLEGFIMDPETSNEKVGTPRNEITFDGLELPKTSTECSSIMEKVCKSASMQTPQILSIFKLQGIHACHQSVPNGLFECADMNRFSASNGHVYGHSRSKVDGTKESLQGMYYDSLPYSKSRYCCDLQNHFTSPVGNLWDKISLHCESSGKRLSSKPEFACFPIEEDPDSGDENEDISVPEFVNKNVDTVVYTCSEREPLADTRAAYSSGTSSVLAAEKCAGKSSLNSVAAEVSFKQTDKKSNAKVRKHSINRDAEKENGIDILLIGEKGTKNSDDSPNKIYSKLSSYGTSSRTKQLKLSVKEPKQKNIVSNVTSFIPTVQQKKDAALCKGKRDIKVKALGAAKAAKRQQEKRDQERKLRKEALKLDRARVEREDLRLVELNKKKKQEEERKKKDAEIAAKKRAREEAERIERDKKRRRMEDSRKQCLDEGKSVFDKVDKEKQLSILVTPAMAKPVEMNKLKQKIIDTSYEISPYQGSDEEEDNEDVLSDKKVIPSWARKSCVALALPLQHGIEPSVIFPADSFCCTGEVVVSQRQHLEKVDISRHR